MEAILFKNGIEIKRGLYPRSTIESIIGLSAELEWKVIIRDSKPPYDSRVEYLTAVDEDTNELYLSSNIKIFKIHYIINTKTKSSIISAIKRLEEENNKLIVGTQDVEKLLIMTLASLIRETEGATLTAFELTLRGKVKAKGINIYKNHLEFLAKETKVTNDIDPDIDFDWETTE